MRTMMIETKGLVGEEVVVSGWVHNRRDMGKIVFLDLRDRSGLLQTVCVPSELSEKSAGIVNDVRSEYCVSVRGIVQKRSAKQINANLPTGEVELLAKEIEVLNPSKTPPFELDKDTREINEELRLKYRYLDLRSPRMLKNLDSSRQVSSRHFEIFACA